MQVTRPSILLFLLIMSIAASAQNLLEDGRNLLKALDSLRDPSENQDAAAWKALSILSLYDRAGQNLSPNTQLEPEDLLENVQANPLLRGLLPTDSLRSARPLAFEAKSQQDNRKRIETLMYGGAPVSPAQYLSVEQSLKDSRMPPLQNQEALRAAAGNAQARQPVSALRAEALAEGLFQFVLERAQQEVAVSFIENLLNKNENEKALQIGSLFPNVFERYSNPKVSYSQSFLEGLREAFFLDLKNLGRSLPELLFKDKYFSGLQDNPVFYSVLATYDLFGQSNHGRPLWESAPLVHSSLFDRRQAADRNRNITLAKLNPDTDEYRRVQADAQAYIEQLGLVVDTILDMRFAFERRISRLQQDRANDPPIFPSSTLYDYRLLIGREEAPSLHLGLLPELLQGELENNTLRNYNTLEWYDLFSKTSSQEMRIAGLELARRTVDGSWYNGLSHVGILRRWQADLAAYKVEFDVWEMSGNTLEFSQRFADTESKMGHLAEVIGQTHEYWVDVCGPADLRPLVQLRTIAENHDGFIPPLDSLLRLQKREEELRSLEKRVADVEQRLAKKKPDAFPGSPFQQYLRNMPAGPLDALTAGIDSLEAMAITLKASLNQLDSIHALKEHRALKSTEPMLEATELLSNLFYVLQDSASQELIRPDTFETMLYEPRLRTACLGLMQQRLGRIRGVGEFSPEALAGLAQLMLNDFSALPRAAGNPFMADEPDGVQQSDSALFQSVSVGLRALNRVLEFPIFIDPKNPQKLMSLKEKHEGLQYVPEITGHCMDLLYYLEAGQHRPAVSAMVRMITLLGKQLSSPEDMPLLRFLATYGDFIAGLVDARNKEEIQYLMRTLADDPGSSRTKRTHALSASFNTYLGVSFGADRWAHNRADTALRSEYWALAPSIPIGFTFSWLFGKNKKKPQSFGLHLIGVDLGGMLTYRLEEEDEFGAYKFSLKNIIKPGAQLQWNIQKTPCYVALGWQTGAQIREENGEEIALRSRRFFLSVGLDAPIRTLFAK